MRKILFRVDANPKIGFGHFYRCLALAKMISKEFTIVFAMSEASDDIRFILINESFPLISLNSFEYSIPDNREGREIDFDLKDHVFLFDIIVLDGYWFGNQYQSELRKFSVKIIIIEDHNCGSFKADLLINSAEGLAKTNFSLDNTKGKILLGSSYALLRPSFLEFARGDIKYNRKSDRVFICFGGSDIYNKTLGVSNWFLANTKYFLCVVVGKAYPYKEELNKVINNQPERAILKEALNEDEIISEMCSSTFGVVPASGILLESIACRMPVISGIYVKNHIYNYNGLLEKGAFYPAENFLPHQLEKACKQLDENKRIEIVDNQNKTIDGYSDSRIIQCLKEF